MNSYLILNVAKNPKGNYRTIIVRALSERRGQRKATGNLPPLYKGMIINLEINANNFVTDYQLKLTAKNESQLQKNGESIEVYRKKLEQHQMLKDSNIGWKDLSSDAQNLYELLPFAQADKIHRAKVNNPVAEERISCMMDNVLMKARKKRKIEYAIEEYLSMFNEVEQEGAYEKLMTAIKMVALQSSKYGVKEGRIFDNELKQKEEYVRSTIMERLNHCYQLLTNKQIRDYIETLKDSYLCEEQIDVLWCLEENSPCIVTGGAGCVDGDTEFFDGHQWKKISDFQYGDKVLEYHEDGTTRLVHPLNYIKKKCKHMWHFQTKKLDQCLTEDHIVIYQNEHTGKLERIPFQKVKEKQNDMGFRGKLITSFAYSGRGIDLSEAEIRMMTAVFADGSFYYRSCSDTTYRKCRFHLKKERKKERLEKLIQLGNFPFRKKESREDGYTDYYITVPFRAKHFPKEWYECSKEQFAIIADEIVNWDCDFESKNSFSTTSKSDADFVQFAMTALHQRSSIITTDRSGKEYERNGKKYIRKSVEYRVNWYQETTTTLCYDNRTEYKKTEIEPYLPKDGYQYCFTVFSNMLVLRRNGKIFITGNCGKTSVVQALIDCYGTYYKKDYILLVAPTGKASRRLAEKTKMPASTIHRALRKSPDDDFVFYHEKNPLPQRLIIVDESSMIDTELMYDLLQAVSPTSKIIFAGDHNQLNPVGYGEPFFDFMQILPINYLLENHRQEEGTDILTNAQNALEEKTLFSGKGVKIEKIDWDEIGYRILEAQDAQILSPYNELNSEINWFLRVGDDDLNVGDKVMTICNHENYCNGDIGYIIKKDACGITIKIEGRNVFVPEKNKKDIVLAYAMTIHKMQGSESDRVIVFLPSHRLIEKRMLYTAITRARKELEIYYYDEPIHMV